jgi:hypothetical protein
MSRPPSGSMIYWRFKSKAPCEYRFGYVTYEGGPSLIRMGRWSGDKIGGHVVDSNEIEWRKYDDR